MIALGLWGLWLFLLGTFVAFEIARYSAPADAQPAAPFGSDHDYSADPPPPLTSIGLFVVLGVIIPGALYFTPQIAARIRKRSSKGNRG